MIGYVMTPEKGDVDLLLYGFAQDLLVRGHQISGVVQVNTPCPSVGKCDMDVTVLPNGPVLRISQNLGRASRGCRLDTSALEDAVGLVHARLDRSVELLIVNKFGKLEAAGRGFRDVIAQAMLLDVPVLVGVNYLNQKAFQEFTGGETKPVPAKKEGLLGWYRQALIGTPCFG